MPRPNSIPRLWLRLSFGSRNQIVLSVLSVALIPSLQSTSKSSPLWDLKRLFSSFQKTPHLRSRARFAIIWLKTTPSLTMWIYPAVLRSLFLNGDEDLISFLSSKNSLELKVMSLLSLQEKKHTNSKLVKKIESTILSLSVPFHFLILSLGDCNCDDSYRLASALRSFQKRGIGLKLRFRGSVSAVCFLRVAISIRVCQGDSFCNRRLLAFTIGRFGGSLQRRRVCHVSEAGAQFPVQLERRCHNSLFCFLL